MQIIYLLTNKTKTEGKRFYIGSKQDCKIVKLNGVDTIISVSNGKPYMSSSTSIEFKTDILAGNIFEASLLQEVRQDQKKEMVRIENEWIMKYDAVRSDEFYNLGYALLNCRDKGKLANKFGQTVSEYAKDNSNMSKRDGTARTLGFSNYGEFCFDAYEEYSRTGNWAEASRKYGKHKGFVRVNLEPFDMPKAKTDVLRVELIPKIRTIVAERGSLNKACEILGIELPAGRVLLGDYRESRDFTVASNLRKTKAELEIEVTSRILDGEDFRDVANSLGLVLESVKRYFFRCVRRHLKSSDLRVT